MNMIERKKCCINNTQDLEALYCFENFPVFMGCTAQPPDKDIKADMDWVISKSSGLIQLKNLLPLDVLYPEAHGAGCVGALWNMHHKSLANFIKTFSPSAVLEIGGSHGILETEFSALGGRVPWTIVEPNPVPVENCKAEFIKGFFDENFKFGGAFDTVVHSHVFEHVYEPDVFAKHLSDFMIEGQKLIFSIPNMQIMLERKYTNCINFEHTLFLSEPYVEYLLCKYGFRLTRKEYFRDDHSIFYAFVKDSTVKPIVLPNDLYEKNKKLYSGYIDYHDRLIAEINQKIFNSEKHVYLFGAHVFAQYLISFGLNTDRIVCLLDNDPNKQAKRLYGTGLFVNSPKILKDAVNPAVILKAGVYNDEIKKDILANVNSEVDFWE